MKRLRLSSIPDAGGCIPERRRHLVNAGDGARLSILGRGPLQHGQLSLKRCSKIVATHRLELAR